MLGLKMRAQKLCQTFILTTCTLILTYIAQLSKWELTRRYTCSASLSRFLEDQM